MIILTERNQLVIIQIQSTKRSFTIVSIYYLIVGAYILLN